MAKRVYATTWDKVTWHSGEPGVLPDPEPPRGKGWRMCGSAVDGDSSTTIFFWFWECEIDDE
jgi:hypothetical protein